MIRGLLIFLKPQQKLMQRWMKKLQFLFTPNICIFFYRDAVGELPKLGDTTRLNKKIQKGFCNYQPSLKAKSTD